MRGERWRSRRPSSCPLQVGELERFSGSGFHQFGPDHTVMTAFYSKTSRSRRIFLQAMISEFCWGFKSRLTLSARKTCSTRFCQKHANQQQASLTFRCGMMFYFTLVPSQSFGVRERKSASVPFFVQNFAPATNFNLAHFKKSTIELRIMHYHGMLTVNSKHHPPFVSLCFLEFWCPCRPPDLWKVAPHSTPFPSKIVQRKGFGFGLDRFWMNPPATHFNLVQFKKSTIELKTMHYHGTLTVWYSMWFLSTRSPCNQF